MTTEDGPAVAFGLLSLAILALALPRDDGRTRWAWVAPWALAVLAALLHGFLRLPGLAILLLYAAACAGARMASLPRAARGVAVALVLALSAALMLHVAPGFRSPVVMDRVVLGPGALPFTKHLNFDKAAVGLLLLGIWYRPALATLEPRVVLRRLAPRFLLVVLVVLLLSLATGYVRWDPKASPWFPVWAWSTLLFTVVAEEALFRGVVQTSLGGWLGGTPRAALTAWLAASLLFGVAHLAGGPLYVLLATVAGLGYGWVFARTASIGAAILTHGGVNVLHFTLLTYPALDAGRVTLP